MDAAPCSWRMSVYLVESTVARAGSLVVLAVLFCAVVPDSPAFPIHCEPSLLQAWFDRRHAHSPMFIGP